MKAIMLFVYAPNCCYACWGRNLSLKYSGLNSVAAVADIVTCEISNGAGPGSAPLASAIFKEENCNHGQKVAFLV